MAERAQLIEAFLAEHGWAAAERRPIEGDASFRRYERLSGEGGSAILMDAPPPEEDVGPFVTVARHLVGLGLSAPRILAEDRDAGLLLLEDLGDDTFTRLLDADGADLEVDLYGLAVDVLIALHKRPAEEAVPDGLPPYGNGRLLDEAFLLPQWYMADVRGQPLTEAERRAYGDAWLEVFPFVHAQPKTLVLRDFHVDNLMVIAGREDVQRCGLLDFQDAVRGAAAYDLMSLLEDARRDISDGLRDAMMARYMAAFPRLDRRAFEAAFRILAAQRHAKVIGIFTRLCVRDGKPRYLERIPRVWGLLERALEDPVLAPVARWFEEYVPAGDRRIPPCAAAVA